MAPAVRIHAPRKLMRALLQRLGDSQAERADSEAAVARALGIAGYFDLGEHHKIEEAGIRTIVRLCIAGRQIVRRHPEHADLRRSQGHRAIHRHRSRQQLVQAASDHPHLPLPRAVGRTFALSETRAGEVLRSPDG